MNSEGVPPDSLLADSRVGGYTVESYIGPTPLGKVYRAKHSLLNKAVAIMISSLDLDDRQRSKFFRAARKAMLAGQPVKDMGEWMGRLYVVVGFSEERGPLVDMSQWYEG